MTRSINALLTLILTYILLVGRSHSQRIPKASTEELADDAPKGTVFNGQDVPPITALSGQTYAYIIDSGYWYGGNL